ncbi:TRAP transporter small permease subunit [Sporosarcina ureilytica]|uniref:Tripartite ATP-independent periplasmic transporters DctQ component domain-containing protein n=1 Tax=Sporosarcina ureilytica TaxID=298596 RepID=A0A1D8JFJ5_9BACL|nr:TRAP transporter small permease subunit [Sporosarcina ureilytica]AOV07481.1 hypothetical protein BI350_07990 [Sporosarcina ureilytica]
MKKITNGIDAINLWVGRIGAWSVLALTLVIVFEVVSRRLLNSPTIWGYEVITMIYGFHFMIVAGYALLHKSLVSVDILYERFSPKMKAILDIATYLMLFFPFVITVLFVSYDQAIFSWSIQEKSSTLFGAPLYLTKTVIPIAFLLLALQGGSEVLKRIMILMKEGENT